VGVGNDVLRRICGPKERKEENYGGKLTMRSFIIL
jgi:hypothetical protein